MIPIALFLLSSLFSVVGSNLLVRIINKAYPHEQYFSMRPPKRLIMKLKAEQSDNVELLRKVKLGVALERLGLMGFGVTFMVIVLISLYDN